MQFQSQNVSQQRFRRCEFVKSLGLVKPSLSPRYTQNLVRFLDRAISRPLEFVWFVSLEFWVTMTEPYNDPMD